MKKYLLLLLPLLVAILIPACTKDPAESAITSPVNGFYCEKCGNKLMTDARDFPTACPKCKSPSITEAIGFFCPKDKTVTVVPRGPKSIFCQKCSNSVEMFKTAQRKGTSFLGSKEGINKSVPILASILNG